jgi:hypothetical protein
MVKRSIANSVLIKGGIIIAVTFLHRTYKILQSITIKTLSENVKTFYYFILLDVELNKRVSVLGLEAIGFHTLRHFNIINY